MNSYQNVKFVIQTSIDVWAYSMVDSAFEPLSILAGIILRILIQNSTSFIIRHRYSSQHNKINR